MTDNKESMNKPLSVVREEVLSRQGFLDRIAEQRSNIARVYVQAPKLGSKHFGKFVVNYKHPP
jgi:hypothetical protein